MEVDVGVDRRGGAEQSLHHRPHEIHRLRVLAVKMLIVRRLQLRGGRHCAESIQSPRSRLLQRVRRTYISRPLGAVLAIDAVMQSSFVYRMVGGLVLPADGG